MSFINIKDTDNKNKLYLEINNSNNDYLISFMNALRRIILSDISIWALDEKKIDFIENNSLLNNEFLKHRLSLIPFLNNDETINYSRLMVSCSIKNDSENIKSVYVSDFKIFNLDTNTELKIESFIQDEYKNILFAKLQYNEYFTFNAHFSQNTAHLGGAQYCPVSTCIVSFINNEKLLKELTKNIIENEKDSFKINNQEKIYKKNKFDNPEFYEMHIESIGFLNVKKILLKALNILKEKIEFYEEKIKDFTFENDFYILNLENENDTLGNLVSSYINNENNILFSGYIIEHPLYEIIKIKIKTDISHDKLLKLLSKKNEYLIDLINKFIKGIK